MNSCIATPCRRFLGILLLPAMAFVLSPASSAADEGGKKWIGTWATAAQPRLPGPPLTFHNQSLRLIVHTSAGGAQVRIRLSNTYGDTPLIIGGAHVARRSTEADIDPATDRILKFHGRPSTTVPAHSMAVSDPVKLDVPALSDLAISLFLPETTVASTMHAVAKQTSYVSPEQGNVTADAKFPVSTKIRTWPFLTGVDIEVSSRGGAIVAFGSSLTDGDGSTGDTNHRWPDLLAIRLQQAGKTQIGVLNEGIIGNRLLADSPPEMAARYGEALGQSGLARFDRDVLSQSGVKYVVVGLGVNDIVFPGSITPATQTVSAADVISGYRQLIARAHKKGVRVIGSTNSPFEDAYLGSIKFYTAEKEAVRQEVNAWILKSGEFDGVIDFDAVVRDPNHPARILPEYDSDDHIHPNNAGYIASANAISLALFER